MESIRDILKKHSEMYPNMEMVDAVKLIYQQTFGPGHIIKDPEEALTRLREEYALAQKSKEPYLAEDIGGGYARVYLNGIPNGNLTIEKLGEIFIESAKEQSGSEAQLEEDLAELQAFAYEDYFQFTGRELERFLREYEEKGYPMVGHSQRYKDFYEPMYRVVKWEILNREKQSFSKVFFKIYDKKLTAGEITFSKLGINKPLFITICNNSSYVPDRQLLEKLKVTMKLTDEEENRLYGAAGLEKE